MGPLLAVLPVVQAVSGGLALPSYAPASSSSQYTVAVLTKANGKLTNNAVEVNTPWYDPFRFHTIYTAYSGGALLPDWGTYGALLATGTGHSGGNSNQAVAQVPGPTAVTFVSVNDASPIYGTGTDATTQGNNAFGSFVGLPQIEPSTCVYPVDGQVAGSHTYGNPVALPAQAGATSGVLFLPIVSAATRYDPPTNSAISAHMLRVNNPADASSTRKWVHVGTHPTLGFGTALNTDFTAPSHAVYDPPSNRVFLITRKPGPVRWCVPNVSGLTATYVDGTGTQLDASDFGTIAAHVVVYVPTRRLAVMLYRKTGGNSLGVKVMDCSVAQPGWVNTGLSLASAVNVDSDWTSADWCSDLDRIVVGDLQGNRAAVAEITIPAVLTTPWPVEQVNIDTTITAWLASGSRTLDNGNIYGKWRYNAKVKAFMLHQHGAPGTPDTVFMIRPRNV
jgi:hypothetical protein